MHTLEVEGKNKVIKIPENWDECSRSQVNSLFKIALLVTMGAETMADYYLHALNELNIFKVTWQSIVFKRLLGPKRAETYFSTLYLIANQTVNWAFKKDDHGNMELNYNTVRQNLPVIQIGRKKLYGPEDLLADLTFGEFRNAKAELDNHHLYAKDPETYKESEEAINNFIACLYRPADRQSKNDPERPKARKPFNAKHINASHTSRIPMWQKMQIMAWFTYCINYIQTEDLLLDGIEINFSPIFPKPLKDERNNDSGPSTRGTGWTGLLHSIAKEGVFGDAEKTDQTLLFDVLLYMYKNHLDNIKLQQHNKRNRK